MTPHGHSNCASYWSGTEGKIERLYGALAEGTVNDTDLFRKSLSRLEAERDGSDQIAFPKALQERSRRLAFSACAFSHATAMFRRTAIVIAILRYEFAVAKLVST